MFESNGFGRKKKRDDPDMDITPMIDVVFLLLIFFMVTSTMQGTPDKDIPPSYSGTNANVAGFAEVAISASAGSQNDSAIRLDGVPVTLDHLKSELLRMTADGELKVMIFADRDVKSRFVGEIEQVVGEVEAETGKDVLANFAVRDKR